MSTSKDDLLLAILSMDAYNQGYGRGIEHGKTQIGTATFTADSGILKDENDNRLDEAAGFYAVSYYTTEYGKVISYRGTDGLFSLSNLNPWSDTPGGDIWNGYGTAAAKPHTNQSELAAEFFQAVTGTSDSDPRTGSATLVGHSLGGGLAGFIGAMDGL